MPIQTERSDQSHAMDAFAAAAREAKLAEDVSADRRGKAAEELMAAGCELLAVEGNRHHGNELSPHLKIHLDRVSAHLADHIGQGPAMADKRRAVLARALPFASEQKQGATTDLQLATALNTPSRGRPLQLLNKDETRPVERRFSREFTGAGARNLVAALSDLQTSLNVHSRRMESVFDLEHAHRDVPQPPRSPSFIAATPDSGRIWASPAYGGDRESISPGSSPPPTAGRKRERSYDSDTSLPPLRRARMDSPDFNIHEDPDAIPARRANGNDEWQSSRQRRQGFAIYEDPPHSNPGALQPVATAIEFNADHDKENAPPEPENIRGRSRDRDFSR
ncbi:hypothetical protein [Rhizobium nepotum]|uniref:Type III effector protein n=1 Tax=Rhizobium nepotum 39/7 TaxID=1368418 RepID=A0ABR5CLA2_9HYPH|nr:hypothetical protein [Rhizobium nepotum]KJF65640.1 hypothetical protein RS75_21960 [Rhizobium nepotum 39/7]